MAETLKEKTAKGLFWGAMNNGAMQVIGLVFGIVLGRLLSPSDYGMIFSDSQCLAEFGLHHGYHEYQGTYR